MDKTITFIMSCVISYVLISLVTLFSGLDNTLIISAIAILVATIIAIPLAKIYSSEKFKSIMIKHFHKTQNDDIWKDVFDYKNGSNLKVYFKESSTYLIGHYKANEENGSESWFALSGYGKYDIITDKPIGITYHDNKNIIVTFKISDVKHIEIF